MERLRGFQDIKLEVKSPNHSINLRSNPDANFVRRYLRARKERGDDRKRT